MNQNSLYQLLAAVCLALMLTACAGQPPVDREIQISRSDLLSGAAFGLAASDRIPATDTLAVNDDMREFLARHIPAGAADHQKVKLILAAILEEGLHLNYNNFKTFTAEEAFERRTATAGHGIRQADGAPSFAKDDQNRCTEDGQSLRCTVFQSSVTKEGNNTIGRRSGFSHETRVSHTVDPEEITSEDV